MITATDALMDTDTSDKSTECLQSSLPSKKETSPTGHRPTRSLHHKRSAPLTHLGNLIR